jgi:hypothetical protein
VKASLAVAGAYFSFVGLQKWLNWIFGALMAVGLVMELRADSSHSLGGWMIVATLAAVLVAVAPAFAGGLVMRIGSTPCILHLKPEGRRHMLVGATLAMTFMAVLLSLPMVVAQMAGVDFPSKATALAHPGLGMFQIMWGGAALVWISIFALSRYQALAAFSFILVVLIINVVIPLASRLPITADQFATVVFVAGATAWIAFAHWYLRTYVVARPEWLSRWPNGQSAPNLVRLAQWRGFTPTPSASKGKSRAIALCHFLTGTDSVRGKFLFGTVIGMLLLAADLFSSGPPRASKVPVAVFFSAFLAYPIVRRSRLLWLRGGLDRNGLFLTAERHAWRTVLAFCSALMVLSLVLPLTQGYEQALKAVLNISLTLAFISCLLYGGLAITRDTSVALIMLVFPVLWFVLNLETNFSPWTHPIALVMLGALAIGLRAYARRNWLELDWRLTGAPLASKGWRGI